MRRLLHFVSGKGHTEEDRFTITALRSHIFKVRDNMPVKIHGSKTEFICCYLCR